MNASEKATNAFCACCGYKISIFDPVVEVTEGLICYDSVSCRRRAIARIDELEGKCLQMKS